MAPQQPSRIVLQRTLRQECAYGDWSGAASVRRRGRMNTAARDLPGSSYSSNKWRHSCCSWIDGRKEKFPISLEAAETPLNERPDRFDAIGPAYLLAL